MKEIVKINDIEYELSDPLLTKDHFTGEYILINEASKILMGIELDRDAGYQGPVNNSTIYINNITLDENIEKGNIKVLVTRYGHIYVGSKVRVRGEGRLFDSNDPEHPEYLYDNYTNPRMNIANKFRSFDNIIRSFKDLNNKLIPDNDRKALIQRNYDYGVETLTNKLFEGLDYTFGVELETSTGRLSEKDVAGLNLKCEFDGSLRETPDQRREDVLGGEYITGVLRGDAGMYQLQKICNKLSEKCTINGKCGVHVHIGGIKFTKENIVYMYILGEMLQNEFYEMLPASRRNNTYCKKLKEVGISLDSLNIINTSIGYKILIEEYFNKVFKEVSHGKNQPDKSSNRSTNHPLGSKCGYNKETQRYCWLNFVTAMFNTKGNPDAMTLEFRSHSATLNYGKVKNWVRICMAFVSFVENNKASIKRGYWLDKDKLEHNINLNTVIKAVYPKTNKLLINYVEDRKSKFFYDKGDIEELEYKTDKEGVKQLSLKEDINICV